LRPDVRKNICESAVRLCKEAGYTNAGTVEFIVDKDQNFYFIEVNARIQVEHPVTELVTGIDLIKQQIKVAAGEPLPFKQEDVVQRGHAIECRINAEDPAKNFQPSPGKIEKLFVPGGFGVRWDSHAHAGYTVPSHYDSMIGKLLVHQPDRNTAIASMKRALKELRVEGIKTIVPRLLDILGHEAFVSGQVDTRFIERTWPMS
jgi:acetyl-CoA carboxylase biotin carboxylase subunit